MADHPKYFCLKKNIQKEINFTAQYHFIQKVYLKKALFRRFVHFFWIHIIEATIRRNGKPKR
jgi:hypothetical protein